MNEWQNGTWITSTFCSSKSMMRPNKHTNEFKCRQTIDICVINAPAYLFLLSFVISRSEAATLIYSIHR